MVDIAYGNKGLNDVYELYKVKNNPSQYRLNEIEPEARFKACDHIDFSKGDTQRNGVSNITLDSLTIKTTAMLDFRTGDWLRSVKDNKYWKINGITVMDDNTMKQYSNRPRKYTILTLSSKGV